MKQEPRTRNLHSVTRRITKLATPPKGALTQQQFKDECDMNRIVKNAQRGIPPRYMAKGEPQFGDFSNVPDLTEAHNMIQDAHDAFMNLPAELRLELGNNPLNITKLKKSQVDRYGLGKALPEGHPLASQDPAPEAGQASLSKDGAKPKPSKSSNAGVSKSDESDT